MAGNVTGPLRPLVVLNNSHSKTVCYPRHLPFGRGPQENLEALPSIIRSAQFSKSSRLFQKMLPGIRDGCKQGRAVLAQVFHVGNIVARSLSQILNLVLRQAHLQLLQSGNPRASKGLGPGMLRQARRVLDRDVDRRRVSKRGSCSSVAVSIGWQEAFRRGCSRPVCARKPARPATRFFRSLPQTGSEFPLMALLGGSFARDHRSGSLPAASRRPVPDRSVHAPPPARTLAS